MGQELHFGCLKCKRFIWLGSAKPTKWNGFQIGNESFKRFLSFHAECEFGMEGNFLLTNDYDNDHAPWRGGNKDENWTEDILSRSFCFDSITQDNFYCPACKKQLDSEENNRRQNGNLEKGEHLWFCDQDCFEVYREEEKNSFLGQIIYDSTDDVPSVDFSRSLEVGCTGCKISVVIDGTEDSNTFIRDIEYLAMFMVMHVSPTCRLKASVIENPNAPWRSSSSAVQWEKYEY